MLLPRLASAQAATPGFLVKSYDRLVGEMKISTVLDGSFALGQEIINGIDAATIGAGLTKCLS